MNPAVEMILCSLASFLAGVVIVVLLAIKKRRK